MLNGCYPWNRNPLLLCSLLGGLVLVAQVKQDSEDIPRQCLDYKQVTDELWLGHLEDLKQEAKSNEEVRKRAMRGEAWSSEELPAEASEKQK
jgi:hypothetical protein